ncbi:MAG: TVP38/TMEM64 family protein [Clostridia bacterium]|nr:TVP38/TMEM64 family protein [Clostridia bacterium]
MSEKTKKILSLVMIALALVFAGAVTWYVGRPMVRFVEDPEQFRLWVDAHGIWSRLAFVGMVVFQVLIAVIPGEPIEIGGGYAFGFWEGTLWCVVGIGIGSVLIFALVRRFGVRLVELFFSMEKIRSLKFLQNDRRRDTIAFVIFLLPGTPKDLVSYFVGLTPMKLSTWLFISMVARLPSVVTSTAGGSALSSQNYITALVVFAVAAGLSIGGWLLYNWFMKRRQKKKEEKTLSQ